MDVRRAMPSPAVGLAHTRRHRGDRSVFFAIVAVQALLPLGYELATGMVLGPKVLGAFLAESLLLLAAAAYFLRQPRGVSAAGMLVVATVGAAIWLVPTTARERFADDVARIAPGMTPDEVDAIMREHVKGARVPDNSRPYRSEPDLRQGVQPFTDETYFEAAGEDHSFDTCCRVYWTADHRVAKVELHED
jgi:hypothetical protein